MKEYSKRIFAAKYRWQLWAVQDLQQTLQRSPCFWDDANLSTEEFQAITWVCGVEVHEYSIILALYGTHADQVYLGPIAQFEPTAEGYTRLEQEFKAFSIHRFLMETSGIFHFQVKWELDERFPEAQVIVMNSRDLARMIKRVRKSDRADAIKLAQIARYDELLHLSYCPGRDQAYFREITRQRQNITDEIIQIKNRIKKLCAMYGFRWAFNYQTKWHVAFMTQFLQSTQDFGEFLDQHTEGSDEERKKMLPWAPFNPCSEMREFLLFEFHQLDIREAEAEILEATIAHSVQQRADLDQKAKTLETVPGLGWLNSINLLTEIGDIGRFPTMGKFVVYCGIGPAGGTSGAPQLGSPEEKKVEKDRPNRKCNPWLKKIFTQAGMVNLKEARQGRQTTDITRYAAKFPTVKEKRLKFRFKVAAKMARQVYHCLTNGEVFNNQGNSSVLNHSPPMAHKKRIQAKIRKLLRANDQLIQVWNRILGDLTAMGIDPKQLRTIQEACLLQEGNK